MAQIYSFLESILRLSIWLVILTVIFAPLERFFAVHSHKMLRKGIGVDLFYYFLNNLLPAAILSVPMALLAWLVRNIVPDGFLTAVATLPFWLHALLGLAIGDIGYYWGHRWSHEIPFLWRFHSIHHSSEELDYMVNTRTHPFDMVFSRFCGLVPLYLLGFAGPTKETGGSLIPILSIFTGTLWGFFIHANLRWKFGPFQWLATTPHFHHWHHTKNGEIHRNYASVFPWIDLMFGTLYMPKHWPESYGINERVPDSLAQQLINPLLPATAFPQKQEVASDNSTNASATEDASISDGIVSKHQLNVADVSDGADTITVNPRD